MNGVSVIGVDVDEGDGPSDERQLLEAHVRMLDALHGDIVYQDLLKQWGFKTKRRYSGEVLLSVVLAARPLKSLSDFNVGTLNQMFHLLPASTRVFAYEAVESGSVKNPAWDTRLILITDVALMLYRRAALCASSSGMTRYAFVDSSPQVGHD